MILIDALYINGGGAKVLLDYLISELEKTDKKILYLLDERIKDDSYRSEKNEFIFMEPGLVNRTKFYKAQKMNFNTVLCFANLPPNIKITANVYTYFHQLFHLKLPEEMPIFQKFIFKLKTFFLKKIRGNTNYWIVQTELVKKAFSSKFHVPAPNILILPFYPELQNIEESRRNKNQYIYVSNAPPHKNHVKLIDAFCKFFDMHKTGNLILTVSDVYPEIVNYIDQKITLGYPIKNIGFVEREELSTFYSNSEFLIYPSVSESFGLGLVEAIENGCMVIGADLPYTNAVCEPTLLFDPLSVDSIVEALSLSLQNNLKPSINKIKNNISEIISLLH